MIDNTGEQKIFSGQRLIDMVAAYIDAIDAAEIVETAARDAGRRDFVYVDEVNVRPTRVDLSFVVEKEPRAKGDAA